MGLDVRKYKFLQIVRIDAVLAAEPGSPHTVNAALVKSLPMPSCAAVCRIKL